MSVRSRSAFTFWRSRVGRTREDRGYLAYLVVMVGLVTVLPAARAVWMAASSPDVVAALASTDAATTTGAVAAFLWGGAALAGRHRGPALLPAALTHTLGSSDLTRWDTYRTVFARSALVVTTLTTSAAAVVSASLALGGVTEPWSTVSFVAAGALVGILTTVCWLVGQAFPRAAVVLGLALAALGATALLAPALQPFLPSGWVAATYPATGGRGFGTGGIEIGGSGIAGSAALGGLGIGGSVALGGLVALSTAAATAVPALLARLRLADLLDHATRWQTASVAVTSLDVAAGSDAYRGRPQVGRSIRAIRRSRPLPWTFVLRDAVGAMRAPGRLAAGVGALAVASLLVTLALVHPAASWPLGAAAGLLAFAGLGPLTDGVRHAAQVASDLPLYGFADETLLALHALFPALAAIIVLGIAAAASGCVLGAGAASVVGAVALGILALLTRIVAALKGALPPGLLAPIPTPAGDLGAAVRLAWSLDALLWAALIGVGAALILAAPGVVAGAAAGIVAVGIRRWRHRR